MAKQTREMSEANPKWRPGRNREIELQLEVASGSLPFPPQQDLRTEPRGPAGSPGPKSRSPGSKTSSYMLQVSYFKVFS